MVLFECILSVDKSARRCSFKCYSAQQLKSHFDCVHLRRCPIGTCGFSTYSVIFLEQHLVTAHCLLALPQHLSHGGDTCCHHHHSGASEWQNDEANHAWYSPSPGDNTYTTTSTVYPFCSNTLTSGEDSPDLPGSEHGEVSVLCVHELDGCRGCCDKMMQGLSLALDTLPLRERCESAEERVTDKFKQLHQGVLASFKPLCLIRANEEAVYSKVVAKCISYMYSNGRRNLFNALTHYIDSLHSCKVGNRNEYADVSQIGENMMGLMLPPDLLLGSGLASGSREDVRRMRVEDLKKRMERCYTDAVPVWSQEEMCERLEGAGGDVKPLLELLLQVELPQLLINDRMEQINNNNSK